MNRRDYTVLGMMSGTSCDGLDLMLCRIYFESSWKFEIYKFETIAYSERERVQLNGLTSLSAADLLKADVEWGNKFGALAKDFLFRHPEFSVDFIASHGHTVYHQPDNGFTFQLGKGANIARHSQLPVICDFRTTDVAWGGQGAPLVPIGDQLFFSDYDFCINLGGFANLSFSINRQRIAFDVSPLNIVLNAYSQRLGLEYDEDGRIARSGNVNMACYDQLNSLSFYGLAPPKSLGKEWVIQNVFPLLEKHRLSEVDAMATFTEHAAYQLARSLQGWVGKALLTGGGVYNDYFVERLQKLQPGIEFVIPSKDLVNGKEALIFALLGVLRWENNFNSWSSVTGALKDSTGGAIYLY